MSKDSELAVFRAKIDTTDEKILRALNERAELVAEIFAWKKAQGMALKDPAREAEILSRLQKVNDGPLATEAIEKVFRAILKATSAE